MERHEVYTTLEFEILEDENSDSRGFYELKEEWLSKFAEDVAGRMLVNVRPWSMRVRFRSDVEDWKEAK